jgi:hypothetical protein
LHILDVSIRFFCKKAFRAYIEKLLKYEISDL